MERNDCSLCCIRSIFRLHPTPLLHRIQCKFRYILTTAQRAVVLNITRSDGHTSNSIPVSTSTPLLTGSCSIETLVNYLAYLLWRYYAGTRAVNSQLWGTIAQLGRPSRDGTTCNQQVRDRIFAWYSLYCDLWHDSALRDGWNVAKFTLKPM